VKKYICVGDTVPKDMIDYKTIAAYKDTKEAIVDVDDQHDLAMMFTSGTTGKPKAVMHTTTPSTTRHRQRHELFCGEERQLCLFPPPVSQRHPVPLGAFLCHRSHGTILREFTEPSGSWKPLPRRKGRTSSLSCYCRDDPQCHQERQLKLSDYDLSSWKYLEIGAQPVPFEVMKGLVDNIPAAVSNIYGITEGGGGGTFNLYPEDVLRKPGPSVNPRSEWRARSWI